MKTSLGWEVHGLTTPSWPRAPRPQTAFWKQGPQRLPPTSGVQAANSLVPRNQGQSSSRPLPSPPSPEREQMWPTGQYLPPPSSPGVSGAERGGGAAPGLGATPSRPPWQFLGEPGAGSCAATPSGRTHLRSTAARRGSPCGLARSPRPASTAVPARPPSARRRRLPPPRCLPRP